MSELGSHMGSSIKRVNIPVSQLYLEKIGTIIIPSVFSFSIFLVKFVGLS